MGGLPNHCVQNLLRLDPLIAIEQFADGDRRQIDGFSMIHSIELFDFAGAVR